MSQSLLGAFWAEHLVDEYPTSQDQPPAPAILEEFDSPEQQFPFFVGPGAFGRQWYLGEGNTRLIQMQNDRIVVNWRRLESSVYPTYGILRTEIERVFGLWEKFLAARNLLIAPFTIGEVTYVNHLEAAALGAANVPPSKLLSSVTASWPDEVGTPETFQMQQRFISRSPDGVAGRTYVSMVPAVLNGASGVVLNIVVRGALGGRPLADSLSWLDYAHNQVVNTFVGVTNPRLHRVWGLEHDD